MDTPLEEPLDTVNTETLDGVNNGYRLQGGLKVTCTPLFCNCKFFDVVYGNDRLRAGPTFAQ